MNTIKERLQVIAVDHLGVNQADITPEATFDSLGADSLDKIELLLAVEDAFGVEIDEAVSDKWTTIGEVEAYITSKKQ